MPVDEVVAMVVGFAEGKLKLFVKISGTHGICVQVVALHQVNVLGSDVVVALDGHAVPVGVDCSYLATVPACVDLPLVFNSLESGGLEGNSDDERFRISDNAECDVAVIDINNACVRHQTGVTRV